MEISNNWIEKKKKKTLIQQFSVDPNVINPN